MALKEGSPLQFMNRAEWGGGRDPFIFVYILQNYFRFSSSYEIHIIHKFNNNSSSYKEIKEEEGRRNIFCVQQ